MRRSWILTIPAPNRQTMDLRKRQMDHQKHRPRRRPQIMDRLRRPQIMDQIKHPQNMDRIRHPQNMDQTRHPQIMDQTRHPQIMDQLRRVRARAKILLLCQWGAVSRR